MTERVETITDLYRSDEYIHMNPSLHEEDSDWKVEKITPLIDIVIRSEGKPDINLLDVGGGSGAILSRISGYISAKHGRNVDKFLVDLSPGMPEIQKGL